MTLAVVVVLAVVVAIVNFSHLCQANNQIHRLIVHRANNGPKLEGRSSPSCLELSSTTTRVPTATTSAAVMKKPALVAYRSIDKWLRIHSVRA